MFYTPRRNPRRSSESSSQNVSSQSTTNQPINPLVMGIHVSNDTDSPRSRSASQSNNPSIHLSINPSASPASSPNHISMSQSVKQSNNGLLTSESLTKPSVSRASSMPDQSLAVSNNQSNNQSVDQSMLSPSVRETISSMRKVMRRQKKLLEPNCQPAIPSEELTMFDAICKANVDAVASILSARPKQINQQTNQTDEHSYSHQSLDDEYGIKFLQLIFDLTRDDRGRSKAVKKYAAYLPDNQFSLDSSSQSSNQASDDEERDQLMPRVSRSRSSLLQSQHSDQTINQSSRLSRPDWRRSVSLTPTHRPIHQSISLNNPFKHPLPFTHSMHQSLVMLLKHGAHCMFKNKSGLDQSIKNEKHSVEWIQLDFDNNLSTFLSRVVRAMREAHSQLSQLALTHIDSINELNQSIQSVNQLLSQASVVVDSQGRESSIESLWQTSKLRLANKQSTLRSIEQSVEQQRCSLINRSINQIRQSVEQKKASLSKLVQSLDELDTSQSVNSSKQSIKQRAIEHLEEEISFNHSVSRSIVEQNQLVDHSIHSLTNHLSMLHRQLNNEQDKAVESVHQSTNQSIVESKQIVVHLLLRCAHLSKVSMLRENNTVLRVYRARDNPIVDQSNNQIPNNQPSKQSRSQLSFDEQPVLSTAVIPRSQHPVFPWLIISMHDLCGGDASRPLLFHVIDSTLGETLVGQCIMSLQDIQDEAGAFMTCPLYQNARDHPNNQLVKGQLIVCGFRFKYDVPLPRSFTSQQLDRPAQGFSTF